MKKEETNATETEVLDNVSNDFATAELGEILSNGEPIDWVYWASRTEISAEQGARLAYLIDPVRWPGSTNVNGVWPDELRAKIQKLTEWLQERGKAWTLADLVIALGDGFAPYTMKAALGPMAAVASEQQAANRREAGRYTLKEASEEFEAHTGERADMMLSKLIESVRLGKLPVYEPGYNARYRSPTVRDLYEEARWDELNDWLVDHEPHVSWRFPDPNKTPSALLQPLPTNPGISSREILNIFKLGDEWENRLKHRTRYSYLASPVLAQPGAKGRGSNLWNPAHFAKMLMDTKARDKEGHAFGLKRLNAIIESHFADWLADWHKETEWEDT